ncbi:hypothetical protein [Pendulispora albinea]|uniref:Uncharacterized protein n=1 Tax=Pendulispora albinea TaxID=2741071 RepID=A0ABZ2M4F1_9BACT
MPSAPDSLTAWTARVRGALGWLGRKAARTPFRLFFFALVALACTWPLLRLAGSLNAYRDSHPLVQYEESARKAVLQFGQVPLWDPYYCGGMDLLGTPQSRHLSPTFLLSLIFGTLRAESLIAFAMILIGLEGTYRYVRARGASHLGATLSAPIFATSGLFAFLPALGWYNFFGFELLPWAAFGLRRAMAGGRGGRAGVVITAAAFAWMIGFGGTYTAPLSALFCAYEIVDGLVSRPSVRGRRLAAMKMVALAFVLALGLSAARLWPVLQTLQMAPRIVGGAPGIHPKNIFPALLGQIRPDENGDFPIAGNYLVGGFCVVAVAAGLARKKMWSYVLAGAAVIWLAQGYGIKVSLFAALRQLPIYSALRYPERFLVLLALLVSVVAALGITRLQVLLRAHGAYAPTLQVVVFAALAPLLLAVNLQPLIANHHAAANGRPMVAPPVAVDQPFRQARGTRWALAYYGPMERGCLSCYDAYPVPQSRLLRGDLPAEEYLEDPSGGTVSRTRWTPNAITLHAELTKPGRVFINQNWHPGWRTSEGTVENVKGLLAVALPAGAHDVVVRFLPRAATGGAAISLTTLIVLIALLRRRAGVRALDGREYALAVALPLAPLALTLALVHEPSPPSVDWKTPTGEDIVADAPPADATRIDAQFAEGVTLEAFKVTPSSVAPESVVTLELDWRVSPDVGSKMGVFVHVLPASGGGSGSNEELRADHVMISDVLAFEKAPPGKTLRDVVQMTIPYDAARRTWTVHVGLWRVRGNGKRIFVVDPGKSKVDDHRLELGTFTVQ